MLAAAPAVGTDAAGGADWIEDGALCLRAAGKRAWDGPAAFAQAHWHRCRGCR